MVHSLKTNPLSKRIVLISIFQVVFGIFSLFVFLNQRSEQGSGLFFGYSLQRLLVAFATLVGVAGLIGIIVSEVKHQRRWMSLKNKIQSLFSFQWRTFWLISFFFTIFLSIASILFLALSPVSKELVIFQTLLKSIGLTLLWVEIILLGIFYLTWFHYKNSVQKEVFLTPLRLSILFACFSIIYFISVKFFAQVTWDLRMRDLEDFFFLPVILFLLWGVLHQFYNDKPWYTQTSHFFLLAVIGIVTYTIYRHTAQWMAWTNTPSKAYWHELAAAFLQGKLYLSSPETMHDLTLFNGNWYVPNPPLPVFIIMPIVAILGAAKTNTVLFSITIGAINTILVYLILDKATRLELITTTRKNNIMITALFAFGTPHMWLAIMGRMWFISQLLTLSFAALAVLFVLYQRSPWWVGVCLGLAVLSRPNIFTLWPFLAGLAFYFLSQPLGKINWWNWFKWSIQSAIPVILAVGGLLFYNYIRFSDFFDFGYVTINSAEWLMESVQTYGIFNAHFLPANLNMMFLRFPQISISEYCFTYSPTREGVSILSMTPALIFVFRRFKNTFWTIGAWISTLLTIFLLLFYHNTGAWQLGYRYLMDFILPILLLLAIGIGRRSSRLFYFLTILSIISYLLGTIWWFNMWWC